MTTLTPDTVQWLFQELDHAAAEIIDVDKPRYRWLIWDSIKTEVAISIAVALRYQIKGGEG